VKVRPLIAEHLKYATKTITFDGTSGKGLAGTNVPVFDVTGDVIVIVIVPFCSTLLAEAAPTATVSLGVVNAPTLFLAASSATNIDASEFWVITNPSAFSIAVPAALKDIAITQNVVIAPATQNVTAGVLRVDCYWMPLSADGNLVAA